MKHRNLYRIAVEGIVLAACVFLFCSAADFDIGDAPGESVWPHNQPVGNWCGPAGALAAYYLHYYIGPGVLLGLFACIWLLTAHLIGRQITQPVLRLVGMLLLVAAASTTWFLLWPDNQNEYGIFYKTFLGWVYHYQIFHLPDGALRICGDEFPMGNGGILGIVAGQWLLKHCALLGTVIVLCGTWVVGAILLADTLVLAMVRGFGYGVMKFFGLAGPALNAAKEQSVVLSDIWKRLSEKQKAKGDGTLRDIKEPEWTKSRRPKITSAAEPQETPEGVHTTADLVPREEANVEPQQETPDTTSSVAEQPETPSEAKPRPIIKPKPAPKSRPPEYVPATYDDYRLPPLDLLREPEKGFAAIQGKMVEEKAHTLEGLLHEFGIDANVVNAEPGPAITMYELQLAPGIKVNQISNLANDMARALGSGSVRVVAPLPGKHTIGIEVPNSQRETVRLKDLILRGGSQIARMQIPLFLGKSSSGEALVSDLASMPHLLIAGTTGSGKSVCINTIITSILLTRRPDEVKMILIDPKMVEMAVFESIPHLMCPTVTEVRRAEQILEWATTTMDERYELLAEAKVRNLASYNMLSPEQLIEAFAPSSPEEEAKIPKKLPHIVIIIDELADLMMTSAKEVEAYIVRIAQKSRAVGIHLIVATQRPQATVVTGLIKANMPCRIGFRVAARMDSRIILDQNGAETLLGQGDMLFLKPGTSDLIRSQGAYLDDDELRGIVKFLKDVAEPQFHPDLMQLNRVDIGEGAKDELFDDAVRIVLETKRGSVSLLQRKLSIGYARASRIIEMMAIAGILGEYKGSQAREVVVTLEEYEQMRKNMIEDEVAGYTDLSHHAAADAAPSDDEDYDTPTEELDDDEK
ncbi:MAG: DNA translocase FtsK [Planctomycetes bacterium]|nr:DNA translocase FtsK [Planctomycetota bacterium]